MNIQLFEHPGPDAAWDAFLQAHPAGHHVQSCAWGTLKATFGWQVVRWVAYEDGTVVGGAQILLRTLPVGYVGYMSKGPVIAPGRDDVMTQLFAHIERFARKKWVFVLSIQPPEDAPLYMRPLQHAGFRPSSFYVIPPDTVTVDLRPDVADILAAFKQKTRYNIRLAGRKGVVIQQGNFDDLATFYALTQTTARRNTAYSHYDLAYYQQAWRLFAPHGMLKLFIAYADDQPLASLIAFAFGDWGVYKWGASSNIHREKMPNHLLQWTAIQWCKAQGCRHYDMGGITPVVAEALKQGVKARDIDHPSAGVARFKLTFGNLVTFPASYDQIYTLRPRWLVRQAITTAWQIRWFRGLVRGARG